MPDFCLISWVHLGACKASQQFRVVILLLRRALEPDRDVTQYSTVRCKLSMFAYPACFGVGLLHGAVICQQMQAMLPIHRHSTGNMGVCQEHMATGCGDSEDDWLSSRQVQREAMHAELCQLSSPCKASSQPRGARTPLPMINAIGMPAPPASRRVLRKMLPDSEATVTCTYTCTHGQNSAWILTMLRQAKLSPGHHLQGLSPHYLVLVFQRE